MAETSAWEGRCETLGEELLKACADAMPGAELRLLDRSVRMLAEEDDPNVVPYYPIGVIYQFHVEERRTRHLFGWKRLPSFRTWSAVVSFGMEEMWNASRWAEERGLWADVRDPRAEAAARSVLTRFSSESRVLLRIHGTSKDP